jgi:hypothetical protein
VPSRCAEDMYAGWWRQIAQLGAAPRVLVWDGEGAVGRWRARRIELTAECQAFRGILGAKVIICKPADPEAKGLVERLHDYLERSFLPGRIFTSPADFNAQLAGFLARANARVHRVLCCRPLDRIDADKAAMLALPPVPPAIGWQHMLRLPSGSDATKLSDEGPDGDPLYVWFGCALVCPGRCDVRCSRHACA